MARNPLIADTRMPQDEPHHSASGMRSHPAHHPHKVRHQGRPVVEMPRSHGARTSAAGRDMHVSSDRHPKLPGMKEPSGVQRIASARGVPGNAFGGGTPGRMSVPNRTVKTGSQDYDKHVGVPGNRAMRGGAKPGGPSRSDKAAGPVKSVR